MEIRCRLQSPLQASVNIYSDLMLFPATQFMVRKFDPGFRINLGINYLTNALDTSHEVWSPLPLTAAVMEMMQALRVDDMGECDHGALVRYYERMAKVEVKR